ncbi:30S ribosomal protein S13 [candidate division WWE3 bacterium RIFCSPHIGHO2_01_FULL_42_13]|uniref:Small ribosomal subunit protein uS13 n=1 Tax=candidate division WWE3 bacterium RIFCSPHIGHO2_01_FULL_42_13 TaxID=1802617 RepID=A0A1F4UQL2_UNCKA|nr:MAG: 30S ribosomal protein S13 [candidate division WWE3 bacterium RIFCSPHIGHO2_01_FULL_42_13]
MARISGVDIPEEKRVEVSLTYIFGIGPTLSRTILRETKVNPDTRVKDLTEAQLALIRDQISKMQIPVEGELKRMATQNIKRLQEIKSYRGLRHRLGLPTRGQRTRSNARTRKGKRKTVGGLKRKITKT